MARVVSRAAWQRIVAGVRRRPPDAAAVVALREALGAVARRPGLKSSEDLVSDVLVRLLERPGLLATVRAPETYLRLLLRREQYVALRRLRLEERTREDAARAPAPEAASPAGLVARLDLQRLLERAGDRLTDADRRLLHLRFWEGQDLRAVAKTLGISYTSAAVRAFRLLAKLRACLGPEGSR